MYNNTYTGQLMSDDLECILCHFARVTFEKGHYGKVNFLSFSWWTRIRILNKSRHHKLLRLLGESYNVFVVATFVEYPYLSIGCIPNVILYVMM